MLAVQMDGPLCLTTFPGGVGFRAAKPCAVIYLCISEIGRRHLDELRDQNTNQLLLAGFAEY